MRMTALVPMLQTNDMARTRNWYEELLQCRLALDDTIRAFLMLFHEHPSASERIDGAAGPSLSGIKRREVESLHSTPEIQGQTENLNTEVMMIRYLAQFPLLLLGFAALAGTASARIRCDNEFQIINGQRVATPYCEAEQLAGAARGYGIKISGEAIRKHPQVAEDLCRGSDRSSACATFQD